MAFISMLIAWLGATAWFGAVLVRHISAGDESIAKRFTPLQEYGAAQQTALRHLRQISGSGMGAIVAGNLGVVISRGKASPLQATISVAAALALLVLVFHVEHYAPTRSWQIPAKVRSLLLLLVSGTSVVMCSVPLVLPAANPVDSLIHWALTLTCSLLIGIAGASIALIPLLKALPSPENEHLLADIGGRWTMYMGSSAAILAIAGATVASHIGNGNRLLVLLSAVALTLPFIAIISLRISINLRLEYALTELPILGIPERSLRARNRRDQAAAHRVWRRGIASTLITIIAAGFVLTYTLIPLSMPPPHVGIPTISSTAPVTPTITPVAAQMNLFQTQKDHDIAVTLSSAPLIVGKNTLHLTVTDAQGQPIPTASVTLVVNSMLVNAGGVTLPASPDPASNPAGFSAMVTLTQPDTWQIVVLVATADQSLRASVVFAVNVAASVHN